MSKLDNILDLAGFQIFPKEAQDARDQAKQQVKELMLRIIGEDEYPADTGSVEPTSIWYRNALRSEQRKKVEEL